MSRKDLKNVAHSVRQRLLNIARDRGEVAEWVYRAYGRERLLYRLTQSGQADRFVLKGATLFSIWTDEPYRPTRDLDLLGYGDNSAAELKRLFRNVCTVPVDDDGLEFDPDSVRTEQMRADEEYPGVRVILRGQLGQARIPVQVDVGYGDAVVPSPEVVEMPTILPDSAPVSMKAYPREAVVAEKFETIVRLGMGNSRMRDFYDVWSMARSFEFDGATLAKSLVATFERRGTPVPRERPTALTVEFSENKRVKRGWLGFLGKDSIGQEKLSLAQVVKLLGKFLMPPAKSIADNEPFNRVWSPGGPWEHRQE